MYEIRFEQSIAAGLPVPDAAIEVIEAYLDGKPARRGKHAVKAAERDAVFWTCQFLTALPIEVYEKLPFVLALARYMGQEKIANFELIRHLAQVTPETVRQAARYSSLVLRQHSMRWKEIEQLAVTMPAEFGEFCRVCHTFDGAHRERVEEVEAYRKLLAKLSPLDLLIYASVYAFEHLLPEALLPDDEHETELAWYAINDILTWKLQTSTDKALHLTESIIGSSLRTHLSPFLFPSPHASKTVWDIYHAFGRLVAAQVELNEFLERSVDAFCYKDSIRFEFSGTILEIVELDPEAHEVWKRNGEKLARLHNYWFYRALDEFVLSGMALVQLGRPENQEANQFAYIKAIRTQLQLTEVYGLDESIVTETGLQVDLFQALLSLELMTVFYNTDFLMPYIEHLNETGHWRLALARLAMGGIIQGMQNRLPVTFSEREAKIKNIQPWTVSKDFPRGNAKAAEAILDFWSSDLRALSAQLREGGPMLIPELIERPILKIGRYLFELPWLVAMQNNSTAALNNLRRLGARRAEAGVETRRIEQRLATRFEEREFRVCVNYQPPRTAEDDPGEVDLICVRDGRLLVLEIKSTFLRQSAKEAWLHKNVTLRKAGLQLRRKVEAVRAALTSDAALLSALGFEKGAETPEICAWIVDTCIEHDHEIFSGFLKVSLEEILIALRDDRHLLDDPDGLFSGQYVNTDKPSLFRRQAAATLYPNGFSGNHFIKVIEEQAVWQCLLPSPSPTPA